MAPRSGGAVGQRYRWPILLFLAVSYWNLLGAGLFGLLINNGYWYARSAEFMGKPIIHLSVWMRVPGDTVFCIGALLIGWFVFRQGSRRSAK